MVVGETIAQARAFLDEARRSGKSIGFVATMGALHDGHWSLVDRALAESEVSVVSIFVNPLQFGAGEDLGKYPRMRQADLDGCQRRNVSLVFCPAVEEMYEHPVLTDVHVKRLSKPLCGPFRQGHFDGVCTVVCKLFNIIQPQLTYFGEKDYQQLIVVRRMVRDLSMPVEVVACPIVRESDGLALSSRNAYLSPEQRRQAPVIYAALADAVGSVAEEQRDATEITAQIRSRILRGGADAVDYVSVVDANTLEELRWIERRARMCAAARFGGTRLIDNVAVDGSAPG